MNNCVITNGNGTYIRHDQGSGKYVTVIGLKYADRWNNIQKAASVLQNSIPKSIRGQFAVQIVENAANTSKDEERIGDGAGIAVSKDPEHDKTLDENVEIWLSRMNDVKDAMDYSGHKKRELQKNIQDVNKEIMDAYHYIEFGNFNAYQGWLAFKKMQSLLRERREYKDQIQIMNVIRKAGINNESIDAAISGIQAIKERQYSPRSAQDLFHFENLTLRKENGFK